MKRIALVIAALAVGTATYASGGQPGVHFIESWDSDSDGQVTLAEVTERRGDIFNTFDENDDGTLSAADYVMFDETRAADHEGQGQGKGGQGGAKRAAVGMTLDFNDTNQDGAVSRDEFIARTADWFGMIDRNGDGIVTTADFGRNG